MSRIGNVALDVPRYADARPRAPRRTGGLSRVLGPLGRQPAGKIVLPYLILFCLLALPVTYATTSLVVGSLEEKFREDLAAAGISANEAMVRLESSNLAALRQMIFTVGVDEAVAAQDGGALQRLLAPIAANARVPYVDVFRPDGAELLALRSPELGPTATQLVDPGAREWAPIRSVLRGESDELGDRYAGIVFAPWGPLFVTAAPVQRDGQLLGAVAVALPLGEVASRLGEEAGSKAVALYRPDGSLIASTIDAAPGTLGQALSLPTAQLDTVLSGNQLVVRRVTVAGGPVVETLGLLAIRREPALLLGVGSPAKIINERGAVARDWMIVIFGVALFVALALGLILARQSARPVSALGEAPNDERLATSGAARG